MRVLRQMFDITVATTHTHTHIHIRSHDSFNCILIHWNAVPKLVENFCLIKTYISTHTHASNAIQFDHWIFKRANYTRYGTISGWMKQRVHVKAKMDWASTQKLWYYFSIRSNRADKWIIIRFPINTQQYPMSTIHTQSPTISVSPSNNLPAPSTILRTSPSQVERKMKQKTAEHLI